MSGKTTGAAREKGSENGRLVWAVLASDSSCYELRKNFIREQTQECPGNSESSMVSRFMVPS